MKWSPRTRECGNRSGVLTLAAMLILVSPSAAQQLPEEKVIVTANSYPVPFENLSRAVTVLTREDIENLPVHSVSDLLALAASVDLRSRGTFGTQTDISVRGSAFSQVLVLVDGVRVNDSQTGHHNSDFPVQLQDVDRIEVLLGPGSSVYGADAFGGSVNIITRRESERVRASATGGEHGLAEGSFSAGFQKGVWRQSFSVTGSRSDGFQYDRDFRNIAVSARTNAGEGTSFFVSHVNKEFGANGFYGPAPSREWTDQTFLSFERRYGGAVDGRAVVQGYYRTHGDRFLYDIRTPESFESRHRTHSAGALVKSRYTLANAGMLTLGGEVGGDWISSNNLGDHALARTSAFTELEWRLGKMAVIYPGLRVDYYSDFGAAVSPSLSGSWWLQPRLRLRSSIGRAFRVPTFTELYYHDPNHQADASLKPENAWAADLGADFIPAKEWMASVTLFSRRERDVIDWVRSSPAEKWRTSNIRKLETNGVELGLERSFGASAGLSLGYTRITSSAGKVDYISKYVLDYARDSVTASAFFPFPFAFGYRQTVNFKRRADGRSYWLLDAGLERRFRHFSAGIDASNLLNTGYQEISGIDMPGRWFTVFLRTR